MIVICEKCREKYRIDPAKIPGKRAEFKCKSCSHTITVLKPEEGSLNSFKPPPVIGVTGTSKEKPTAKGPVNKGKTASSRTIERIKRKPKRVGLRAKMAFLFVLIPIVLIAGAGMLYLWQLDILSSDITNVTSDVVTKMAEGVIKENAEAVAKQCKLYLMSHSELKKEDFNKDHAFTKIAVQKVGKTGYSCLYSVPDGNGLSSLWVHPNAKLIGIDLPKAMKKALGKEYHRWWRIYKGAYNGKESMGYYLWEDADGNHREKFMVCTPLEGTPYVVASTTYLDEFTQPVKLMEKRAESVFLNTRNIVFSIMAATLVLIGFVVSMYGNKLTGRIKSLTDVADRISVGELDAEIEVKSKDEIGDLAEAIGRMQDSIRLSIERLRRRR